VTIAGSALVHQNDVVLVVIAESHHQCRRTIVGEQVPGDEHVVEHLAAALVLQGVSGAGVLHITADCKMRRWETVSWKADRL
jgi:hypothetical protein